MELAAPRIVAGYVATAIFGLLAALHIVLPPTLTQPRLVAALLLVVAAVSTLVRFRRVGAPEADAKAWWQSKTIWTSIVSAGIALLALFGVAPALDAGSIVAVAMTVAGLVNAWLYPTVAKPIAAVGNTPPPAALLLLVGVSLAVLPLGGCATSDTTTVRLDVDKALVVSELGFRSAQQTALSGIRSGALTGTMKERAIALIERGQALEDRAVDAHRLADTVAEGAAIAQLSSVVAALHSEVN